MKPNIPHSPFTPGNINFPAGSGRGFAKSLPGTFLEL